jgi:hypothetical protein
MRIETIPDEPERAEIIRRIRALGEPRPPWHARLTRPALRRFILLALAVEATILALWWTW